MHLKTSCLCLQPFISLDSLSPSSAHFTYLLNSFKDRRMMNAQAYNDLPNVSEAHQVAEALVPTRGRLCNIISRHGLSDLFGVRLIHKHFEMEGEETAVFRLVEVKDVCTAVFMGPMRVDQRSALFGKNFLLDSAGALIPFEYTTSPCADPSNYPEFSAEFTSELIASEASGVLGLCTDPKVLNGAYTEFELPYIRSTVMVPAHFLPVETGDVELTTNWIAQSTGGASPADACMVTRTYTHYGPINCRQTRSLNHVYKPPNQGEEWVFGLEQQPEDKSLTAFDKALNDVSSVLHMVVQTVTAAA